MNHFFLLHRFPRRRTDGNACSGRDVDSGGFVNTQRGGRPRLHHIGEDLRCLSPLLCIGFVRSPFNDGFRPQECADLRTLVLNLCGQPLLLFLVGRKEKGVVPQAVWVVGPSLHIGGTEQGHVSEEATLDDCLKHLKVGGHEGHVIVESNTVAH